MTQDEIKRQYEQELRWFKRHEKTITTIGKMIYRDRFRLYRRVLRKRKAGK